MTQILQYMSCKNFIIRTLAFVALVISSFGMRAEGDAAAGKTLFMANCASCHAANMKTKMTGPALAGVETRWESKADLYSWIRNSQALIAAGNPRAVAVWNEYKPTVMNSFQNLKDADIDNILAFVAQKAKGEEKKPGGPTTEANAVAPTESGSNLTLWLVLGSLIVVVLGLYSFNGFLSREAVRRSGEGLAEQKSIGQLLTGKTTITFLTFILVVVAGYYTVQNAVSLGRQQGYQPTQPINFSHQLHAGKNQIPCQYCHDLARRSKHSGIPGVSTCMNCHSAVKQGQHDGAAAKLTSSAEILKIYAAAGFNPNNGKYLENTNLDATGQDTIYHRWLEGVAKDAGLQPTETKQLIDKSFNAAMSMLGRPVEWVRIHNLPDHAYFNHEQHVVAGGVQCQTCHGPVEKMGEVYQYSPLSMGWCINCHRKTDVRFNDNPYYAHYFEQYHQEIKEGKRDKVTVEDVGGLECQKCHY